MHISRTLNRIVSLGMFIVLSLALAAGFSSAGAATTVTTVLRDDFNGNSLDMSLWMFGDVSDGIYVQDGYLNSSDFCCEHKRVISNQSFLPSQDGSITASARVKLTGDFQKFGFHPQEFPAGAFYFDTYDNRFGDPRDKVRLIAYENNSNEIFNTPVSVSWDTFHDFSINWTLSKVTFFIDGQEVGHLDRAFTEALQVGVVNDRGGLMQTDFVEVTEAVESDTTPPVISAAVSGTQGANGWYVSDVTVNWTVTDPESPITSSSGCDPMTITADTPSTGTTLTCSATSAGGTASQSVTIFRDHTPPTIGCSVNPNQIWPPNHKMVNANATVSLSDTGSQASGFVLVSMTSNEPNGANDIDGWNIGTPDTSGQLRAERLGNGSGRIYTLTYQGLDSAGNASTCTATVAVSHDQGK